jgi:hypothetical protein
MMGAPFSGVGTMESQKYISTGIDSMSAPIFTFEGTADADGRIIPQECRR